MPDTNSRLFNEELIFWYVPEFEKHERSRNWYIAAIGILALFAIFSYFTKNFLFVVILILGSIVVVINDGREPDKIKISITDEGIIVGKKFYDYDYIKDFSILYKPKFELKHLYFEFKNQMKPRLSISLEDMNPLIIREILLKYLTEDLERINRPLSEGLAKIFKLG